MATETFTYPINADVSGTITPRVLAAKFGDGYEQVAPDGINTINETWPIAVAGGDATVRPARDFLQRMGGATAFYWTPPMGVQALYRCKVFSLLAQAGDNFVLSATFEKAYYP